MTAPQVSSPKTVSRETWLAARADLLEAEKRFTHARDALSAQRRRMPWTKAGDYTFDGPDGPVKLADLFEGRSQLIVYHFMFAPEQEWGCKSCSFWADQFDGAIPHLNARDTSFVAISRAPVEKLRRHAERLGWKFRWLSSGRSTFNYDYRVSFHPEAMASADTVYNYQKQPVPMQDLHGMSVFVRTPDGEIWHTYSTYGRGQDVANTAYNLLDMTPQGRGEDGYAFTMQWVKLHDEYPGGQPPQNGWGGR